MPCRYALTPPPQFAATRFRAGRRVAAAGFTLIEILVVVVIMGIASAVIVPQLGSRGDLKVSSAARALMADLIYAQNMAITRQQMVYVRFDAAAETYRVLSAPPPSEVVMTHPVNLEPFLVKLGPAGPSSQLRDVLIDVAGFDGLPTLAFDDMGVPYAYSSTSGPSALTAGSVRLRCGVHTLTVRVEPFTGELKVN